MSFRAESTHPPRSALFQRPAASPLSNIGAHLFEKRSHQKWTFIKKNPTIAVCGGCAYEAVLNSFNIDWGAPKTGQLLYQLEEICKAKADLWTDNIEPIFDAVQVLASLFASHPPLKLEAVVDVEDLPTFITSNEPIIVQSGGHYWTFRNVGDRQYVKVDAYSYEVSPFSHLQEMLDEITRGVHCGEIVNIYHISRSS